MSKNYYIILGIPKSSSQKDIRAAYRRLAKEFHPDLYGKDQAPFQIIQEAYSVLSNPKRRKSYDHSLQPKTRADNPIRYGSEKRCANITIEPLIPESDNRFSNLNVFKRSIPQQRSVFADMCGCLARDYKDSSDHKMTHSYEMSVEICLLPIQADRGGNARVDIPVAIHCPSCHQYSGHGLGCWRCNGSGILRAEKPVLISYPAGIRHNHVIKMALNPNAIHILYLNVIFKIL